MEIHSMGTHVKFAVSSDHGADDLEEYRCLGPSLINYVSVNGRISYGDALFEDIYVYIYI